MKTTGEKRLFDLAELDEMRRESYDSARLYKERTKAWHDKNVIRKDFHVGQQVLLFSSRFKLFPSKLKSRWSGPFTVTKVFGNGAFEIVGNKQNPFSVNGQCLKAYYDAQTFLQ